MLKTYQTILNVEVLTVILWLETQQEILCSNQVTKKSTFYKKN